MNGAPHTAARLTGGQRNVPVCYDWKLAASPPLRAGLTLSRLSLLPFSLPHFSIGFAFTFQIDLLSNAWLGVCLWGSPSQDTQLVYEGSKLRKERNREGWLPHKGEMERCRQASWGWPHCHLLPSRSYSNEQLLLLVMVHSENMLDSRQCSWIWE